jgi:hypothetical protein
MANPDDAATLLLEGQVAQLDRMRYDYKTDSGPSLSSEV